MNKWILILWMSLLSSMLLAHQPDISSTILAQQKDKSWILQIRSPLSSFEYEIKNKYGSNSFATPEEFKNLVLELLQENISISCNHQDTGILKNGIVRLGHETNVIFQVDGIPEAFESMEIKNSSFKNINRNQSALLVLKEGFAKNQYTLNEANQHIAQLHVNGTQLILLEEDTAGFNIESILLLMVGLLIVLSITIIKANRAKEKALQPIPISI